MDFLAHYHDEFELFFVMKGTQKLGINNQILTLAAGQIGLVSPWHIHYYEKNGPVKGFMLIFSPDILGFRLIHQSAVWSFDPQDERFTLMASLLTRLYEEMTLRSTYFELAASGLLHRFLADLLRAGQDVSPGILGSDGRAHHLLIQDILSHIARHFREPLDRTGLAQHFGISPSHFSRLFKSATGLSLSEYLARLRIDQARQDLADSQARIIDIALGCGFESIRTFNRCFQRIVGHPPSVFRQKRERTDHAT